jgi:transmembrane sensor
MRPDIIIDDQLLMKYLLQEAGAQEVMSVETWLRKSPGNQQHFNNLKFIWEESLRLADDQNDTEDITWGRIEDRLGFNTPETAAPETKFQVYRSRLLLAASVLLICSLAWLTFNYFNTTDLVNITAREQIITQVLPDGSMVTLNKNTSIAYPGNFSGTTRPVKLKGEAFFHVAHNASKPFIISVDGVTVKVLGTSFNVKSRDNKTMIVVETGTVRVRVNHLQDSIELHQGEYVTIVPDQGKLLKEKNNNNLYNYYSSNQLNCEGTPLYELVDVLNEKFKTDIVIITPALVNKPVTADFTDQSLEEILKVVSGTLDIHVEHVNQQILLK